MSTIKKDLNRYTPRVEQEKALSFIKNVVEKNKDIKFFLMNLPTGSGKSHLAMMISDYYSTSINKYANIDVLTPGKLLQDQYSDEYTSISNLKGVGNYNCNQYDCSCASGKEFNSLNKTLCEACPHETARVSYVDGKLSMTNFHLYLIYALYAKEFMKRDAKLLIVDEAHLLDEVMTDFISMKITESTIKKLMFSNDLVLIDKLKNVCNIDGYVAFLKTLRVDCTKTVDKIKLSMGVDRNLHQDKRSLSAHSIIGSENPDIKLMKVIKDLEQLTLKIDIFTTEYEISPNNWVLESSYNETTKQKDLSLEPIWAFDYLNKYVWSKYDMVILMSGTILNKELFCQLNGIPLEKSVYYSIPTPFPQKNRPIYYIPIGKMSYTKKEETFEKIVPFIEKVLKKYSTKKGIIHTNSFELSNWISRDIKNPRLVYHTSATKEEVIKAHFNCKENTVIVSPSLSTGVSFDHDRARFQIIAKIPYPSLASQKNKMRQQTNPDWYSYVTVAKLIQTIGRIVRSRTDFGDTIIIDESFGDIMRYSSKFLPIWLQETIIIRNMKK